MDIPKNKPPVLTWHLTFDLLMSSGPEAALGAQVTDHRPPHQACAENYEISAPAEGKKTKTPQKTNKQTHLLIMMCALLQIRALADSSLCIYFSAPFFDDNVVCVVIVSNNILLSTLQDILKLSKKAGLDSLDLEVRAFYSYFSDFSDILTPYT